MRFLCEVRVPSFTYIGAGNSTNKKDAERNAARDFCNFLIRSGKVNANELPVEETGGAVASIPQESNNSGGGNSNIDGGFQRPQVYQVSY